MISEWGVTPLLQQGDAKIQGGSSPTMISEWGVTPLLQQGDAKIQGGSTPTMISEWGVTPLSATEWFKNTRWCISHYDFRMGCDPPPLSATGWFILEKSFPPNNNNNNNNPNNNNNWDRSMTCRPSAAGKKNNFNQGNSSIFFPVLCSPVFVPQMVGGVTPPGLVTSKVSVRQLEAMET